MANREAKFAELKSPLAEAADLYVTQSALIWESKIGWPFRFSSGGRRE